MRSLVFVPALSIILAFLSHAAQAPAPSFTVEQILGFPAPENLVASPVGSAVAWAFNERGVRNVYVAEGPDFTARRVTSYTEDDGQELTQLSFSGLDRPIRFVAPSTSRDSLPAWSADGRKIAFLRQPGTGGTPRSPLARVDLPWKIVVADLESLKTVTAVTSGDMPVDPILQNPGGLGLQWGAGDTLLFMSYRDGFLHLYSLEHPGSAGKPLLLTPGSFMVEQVRLTPDRRFVIYNANAGPDRGDVDRRHLFKVPVNAATPTPLTSGAGIEWSPVVLSDGQTVAYLTSDAQRPPLPAVVPMTGGAARVIAGNHLAADFPSSQLVTPEQVVFRASDGVEAHGQLFRPASGDARKPAVVYVHGGGPRQMLLGWHYRWEYADDYAINQYFASRGFIVLSVNYRMSVGYGAAYEFPEHTGARGASEYRDVQAAGLFLQRR